MNILSLFDGMSCGQIALNRLGVKYNKYYAAEIDRYAIKVTQNNFPCTVQLGDVLKIKVNNLPQIDLLLGGSPCQGFSLAGKNLNFNDERSKLFFEYVRILGEIKEINPNIKFLLENVKMKNEHIQKINEILGVNGLFINSRLLSAQNRPRWYWTNIENIETLEDKNILLEHILESKVQDKYYIKNGRLEWLKHFGEQKEKDGYVVFNPYKAKCFTVRSDPNWNTPYIIQTPRGYNKGGVIYNKSPTLTTSSWQYNNLLCKDTIVRRLTPVECERLQTVPDNYTNCVSDAQRYKMLGNGWTVDIICHLLKNFKEYYE